MAFSITFTVGQTSDCSEMKVTDTTDYITQGVIRANVTSRKLTIQKSDGTYLVDGATTFNEWAWGINTSDIKTITLGDIDLGLSVKIDVVETATPASHTNTKYVALVCNTMSNFLANLSNMAVNSSLEKNNKFIRDLMRLLLEKESAVDAASEANIQSAQSALDRAKVVYDNLKTGY